MKKNNKLILLLMGLLAFSSCKKDIPGYFENIGEIDELYPIIMNDKMGYIDAEGEIVISAIYEKEVDNYYELFFVNGLTPASTDGEKYGFLNKEGEFEISPIYDWVYSFSPEGLALTNNGDSWYFINKEGNPEIMLNQYYDFSCYFWDGLAWVEDDEGDEGYIDTDGNITIPLIYYYVHRFSEGLAWVRMDYDDDYMAIDKDGKAVTQAIFESAYPFSEGLSAVEIGDYWGFVDTEGKYVISPQYEWCGSFYDGLAIAVLNDKEGFINQKGEWVVMAQFDYCNEFSSGLASVELNGKWGFIDKNGDWAIQPIYSDALFFIGELGMVQYDEDDEFITWVNKEGDIIWRDQSKSTSLNATPSKFWKDLKEKDRGELRELLRIQLGI